MLTPQFYLFFKGDCLQAMTHYAQTLGGTIEGVFLNKDAASPEERMPGGRRSGDEPCIAPWRHADDGLGQFG